MPCGEEMPHASRQPAWRCHTSRPATPSHHRKIRSPISSTSRGRPLVPPVLRCGYEGFVLGRRHGIYFYPGQSVTVLAIRDDLPLVAPYPKDFDNPDA